MKNLPKKKKIKILLSKNLIKYILMTLVLLCFIILLYNITQNKINSNNLEFKSNPKKLTLTLEKDDISLKNEIKLIENKINLDYSIKGYDITNEIHQAILINVFITINNIYSKKNCFDCYKTEEINYLVLNQLFFFS